MTNLRNSIFLLLTGLIVACGPQTSEDATSGKMESLVGSWKLKSYIDFDSSSTEWRSYPDNVIYQKHLTSTHFTWLRFEKDNDLLAGIGGGTYSFDGETYIENIQFFRPPSSSILGQSITFSADFKEGEWYHTGYAKVTEFDPELAETVVVDSSRIEEIWVKIDGSGDQTAELLGTWALQTYRDNSDGPEMRYPDFVNYIKLITPTHFVWIQYNDEGDEISGAGSGPYSFADNSYTETINVMHPSGNPLLGTEVTFRCDLEGDEWAHFATSVTLEGVSSDTVYIDEVWAKAGNM